MIRTFRFRITAWYVGLFAVLFVGFSLFVYAFLSRALSARVDDMLVSEVNSAAIMLPDELSEVVGGDAATAAGEVVSALQFRGGTIAIYEGDKLLASGGPPFERPPAGRMPHPPDGYRGGGRGGHRKHAPGAGRFPGAPLLPNLAPPRTHYARRTVQAGAAAYEIVAMMPPDGIDAELRVFRNVSLVALPLFLGLAGLGGYYLAKRNLKPLERMAGQAHQITGASLHTRLDPGRPAEELAVLAAAFNELLVRLEQSFEIMRRLVADVSHELRTPLSVIRGEADVALERDRSAAEYRESLTVILDEARRLSRMVEDLLNLARADAGRVILQAHNFYFNDLLGECCRSVQGLAAAKGVALEWPQAPDVPFTGDEELLRRLVVNLLDNAIRYTPAGGRVTAEVQAQPDGVRLRIADTGVGIPADAALHIFDRFFRADKARTRGGVGLGLSIVKWIAESHGGVVEMESRPEEGSTFTVTLPGQR